jgi:hypothetical protein
LPTYCKAARDRRCRGDSKHSGGGATRHLGACGADDARLVAARVVWAKDVYETASNNIAMRLSDATRAYVLVQPDQILAEAAWNVVLTSPLRQYADVFAVSARCSHDWHPVGSSEPFVDKVGRCSKDFYEPTPARQGRLQGGDPETVHFRDVVNRGPLALDANKTRALGFLDERHFYLGRDDHDIALRAYAQHRWLAGYLPIAVHTPEHLRASKYKRESDADAAARLGLAPRDAGAFSATEAAAKLEHRKLDRPVDAAHYRDCRATPAQEAWPCAGIYASECRRY